jgi:hypothetical protein
MTVIMCDLVVELRKTRLSRREQLEQNRQLYHYESTTNFGLKMSMLRTHTVETFYLLFTGVISRVYFGLSKWQPSRKRL